MMLILVCGLPGTGKTTVAKRIAMRTKSSLLSTDVIRKQLFKKPAYDQKEREMVYGELFSRAERSLKDGKNVLVDGTFYRKELRDKVRKIAEKTGSKFRIVEVVCGERHVRRRLDKRKRTCSISDADYCVYRKIKEQFEPIEDEHLVIDTDSEWEKEVDKIFAQRAV